MGTGQMHPGMHPVDEDLVRRLIAGQFPQRAGLAVERWPSGGTVNAMYRLGEDMAVRLPPVQGGAGDVLLEREWLPRLAPHLPVCIPEVLGAGEPAQGYPWPWSVYRWLAGAHPEAGELSEPVLLARDLAAIAGLRGIPQDFDWDSVALAAVIDFGCVGAGDPACDLFPAWNLLSPEAREVFREELAVDDATWIRGRGRTLSQALIALPYYRETNPAMADNARYVLRSILAQG
jgi:aminoglycoside phosphotransferase (APT) family kinase protein